MSRFVFEFDPLLRYRRYRRGLVRELMAGLLAELAREDAERAELVARRAATLDELRHLGSGGAFDVDAASARRFHAGVLVAEIAAVDDRRAITGRQLELCRTTLVEADRDVRVLERLRERRLAEFRHHVQRREQTEIEEAWTAVRLGSTSTEVTR